MNKSRHLRVLPSVTSQGEARRSIREQGDAVVVVRDLARTLVLNCPDGCGEVLTVNLDKRVGKAWRLYEDKHGITLFPSVWRDTGCESHFIIWDNIVLWHDGQDDEQPWTDHKALGSTVLDALPVDESRSYVDIADDLGLIPWRVQRVCARLVEQGKAEEDEKPRKGFFRRRAW